MQQLSADDPSGDSAFLALLTGFRLEPGALLLLAVLLVGYLALVRRVRASGQSWSGWRTTLFVVLGLGSFALLTLGGVGAYAPQVRWVFALRTVCLLVVVPPLLALGKPVALARAGLPDGGRARLDRVLGSRIGRITANPVTGPIVILVLLFGFLTPLAGYVRAHGAAEGVGDVVLPLIGLWFVLPFAGAVEVTSSISIAFGFMAAFVELVADAIPGLVLRLQGSVIDTFTAVGVPRWAPSPLGDQQIAGGVIWGFAELVDLPLLGWLFVRWIRADQAEAARIDALLDAQEAERAADVAADVAAERAAERAAKQEGAP